MAWKAPTAAEIFRVSIYHWFGRVDGDRLIKAMKSSKNWAEVNEKFFGPENKERP